MQRIVLVGANGFVGTHLQKALRKTTFVTTIVPSLHNYSDKQVLDTLKKYIKRDDIVVNLVGRFDLPFSEQIKTNVIFLEILCEVCSSVQVNKLIHISAAAVYGDKKNPSEESAIVPTTSYAFSKKMGDDVIVFYHKLKKLPYIIFRPVNIYGPRSTHGVIYEFIKAFQKGSVTLFGDGDQTRDFLHVEDMVTALVKSFTTKKVNQIYNIGSGKTYSLNGVLKLFKKLTKKHVVINGKPADTSVSQTLTVSLVKIKNELSWKPMVDLSDGLRKLIQNNET